VNAIRDLPKTCHALQIKEFGVHCEPAFPRRSRLPTLEQRFSNLVAKDMEESGISLPSAANRDEQDIDFVCANLIKCIP
jgi:perosamine synthetase